MAVKKEKSKKSHWQDLPPCDQTFEGIQLGSGVSHPSHGDGAVVHCCYSKCLRTGKPSKCRSAITVMITVTGKNHFLHPRSFAEQGWRIVNKKVKEVLDEV